MPPRRRLPRVPEWDTTVRDIVNLAVDEVSRLLPSWRPKLWPEGKIPFGSLPVNVQELVGVEPTPLTVAEVDGTPSLATTTLEFPNGTLTDEGGGVVRYTPAEGGEAPDSAPFVTVAATGALSAETVIPGLAGSADIAGSAGAGFSEEFDSGTDPLTWSPSDPATHASNGTIPSHLYIETTDTTERFGLRAWAPAGAFDLRAKVEVGCLSAVTADFGVALLITNSGNTTRAICGFGLTAASRIWPVQAYTYASGSYTQRGNAWTVGPNNVYLRITRDGSNNISFFWSGNGHTWAHVATQSHTLTVSHCGLRIASNTAGGTPVFVVDWLRANV